MVLYKSALGNLGCLLHGLLPALCGHCSKCLNCCTCSGHRFGLGEPTDGSGSCACNRNMKESENLQVCSTIMDYFWFNTSDVFCICNVFYIHCKALLDVSSLEFTRQTQEDRKFIGGDNLVLIVIASMSSKVSWVIFVLTSLSILCETVAKLYKANSKANKGSWPNLDLKHKG